MSSDEIAIRVRDVSKHYLLFNQPQDRLKQSIVPRLQRLAGRPPKRYYRDFAALSHVSFDVRRGETVGVIGRNGSGKSTLLQIVCGTLRANSGKIEVNGRIAALLELGAGFNPEFTGRENVYLNAAILGLAREEIDARFEDIARFADIGDFIEQPVKTYSSGMYVRLAFATAINVDPDILVVDEALAVGDEAFQRKCYARIEQIQERGGTILFVTHGVQTVVQLCTRALLFDRGELILDGRPKLVTSQYQRLVNASAEAAEGIRAAILALRDAPPAAPAPTRRHAADAAVHLDGIADELNGLNRGTRADVEWMNGHPSAPAEAGLAPTGSPAPPLNGGAAAPLHGEGPEPPDSSPLPLADYYDPNLKPQSTVYLEERGARIRDVRITTLRGEQVNVLQMGKRYVFEYWVDFYTDAKNVGFAFGLRNATGLLLSGASTFLWPPARLSFVRKSLTKRIQFEFHCSLAGGMYFGLCGVRGIVGGEEILMHRCNDAICFRVLPDYGSILTGYFDIGVAARLT